MHPFFSSSFQPFVHRGNSVNFTENTLEAFQDAVNLGYEYIETDLRMTKDGEVVTFHDESIYRVSGEHKNISDLTYEELKNIPLKKGGHIPRLSEVMEQILFQHIQRYLFVIDQTSQLQPKSIDTCSA